ncbi:hypothetical protein [Nitriliruptor alkaliphilus]|uniref:hypothetical protein n=1 Tax=Nitriliruptor alkaliphilus TaxID=427918 RepID=UPI0006987925|nr:hypothetical protein [Nitriliruptor alkaliphilus]
MGSDSFIEDIDVLMQRLLTDLGSAARLERVASWGDAGWKLVPVRRTAAPVWVEASREPATVDVSFGRGDGSGIELGYSGRATGAEVLDELETVLRSIIAGRLVEEIRRGGSSRWRLELPDGRVQRGSGGWLFPVFPWTRTETVTYDRYVAIGR